MPESNGPGAAVVAKALHTLHDGLTAFVERELRNRHGEAWEQVARSGLPALPAASAQPNGDAGDEANSEPPPLDAAALLQVIEQHWSTVFVAKLGPADRAAVSELRGIRNGVVNRHPFSTPEALRALDRMQRLLRAMGQTKEAQKVTDQIVKLVPAPGSAAPVKPTAGAGARPSPVSATRPSAATPIAAKAGTWSREIDPLATAFVSIFGPKYQLFGSTALGHLGLCDGVAGVQWNATVDLATGRATLGVNLEGMQYDGWPIARLIERELASPEFPALVTGHSAAAELTLHWWRDCWQAVGRLKIVESDIAPTPITLDQLTPELWARVLGDAYACMDASRGYRGRGKQMVTMAGSGEQAEKAVSPHLGITTPILVEGASPNWAAAIEVASARLGAIHDWATERAVR